MICWKLFVEFLKIGMFAFGGAYGSIVLFRDVIVGNGWASETVLMDLIALSETTPGPIMINIAGYIGGQQAGLPEVICATLGVVLPSFLILLIVASVLRDWITKRPVQAVLRGVKTSLLGVIIATGLSMILDTLTTDANGTDKVACSILVLLLIISIGYRKFTKREISPILTIVIAGICGSIFYSI